MSKRLDVVLFGATGITGKNCIRYLHKFANANGRSLTWGIASRSNTKLLQVRNDCSKAIGESLSYVPIIIADVNDNSSVNRMTSSAKIIINCCGPYNLYGETIIIACLETETHYVDVAGETHFMEKMYYKYNRLAQQKGIFIVSACGADSIPTDLGIVFLREHFKGTLNSVEIYMHITTDEPQCFGPQFNYASWHSSVIGIGLLPEIKALRKNMFKSPLSKLKPQLATRPHFSKSDVVNKWVTPYGGADRAVIYRSQQYFYEHENIRPVHVNIYNCIDSIVSHQFMGIFNNLTMSLIGLKCGRKLLLTFPWFFSGGRFTFTHPSDDKSEKTRFNIILHGTGWEEHLPFSESNFKNQPNKDIIATLSLRNPGYGFTCVSVTLSAIIILTETDKLPKSGGVYTPGVAFAKTSLFHQLMQNGLTCAVNSKL